MCRLVIILADIDQFLAIEILSVFCDHGAHMTYKYLLISTHKDHIIPKEVFNLIQLVGFDIYRSLIHEIPKRIINFRNLEIVLLEFLDNIENVDIIKEDILYVRKCKYLKEKGDKGKAGKMFVFRGW